MNGLSTYSDEKGSKTTLDSISIILYLLSLLCVFNHIENKLVIKQS